MEALAARSSAKVMAPAGSATASLLGRRRADASSHSSTFVTDDLQRVNESYAMALKSTAEGSESASMNIDMLETTFANFMDKYSRYRPPTVKLDENFTSQANEVSLAISTSKEDVLRGDNATALDELKRAGPIIRTMIDDGQSN